MANKNLDQIREESRDGFSELGKSIQEMRAYLAELLKEIAEAKKKEAPQSPESGYQPLDTSELEASVGKAGEAVAEQIALATEAQHATAAMDSNVAREEAHDDAMHARPVEPEARAIGTDVNKLGQDLKRISDLIQEQKRAFDKQNYGLVWEESPDINSIRKMVDETEVMFNYLGALCGQKVREWNQQQPPAQGQNQQQQKTEAQVVQEVVNPEVAKIVSKIEDIRKPVDRIRKLTRADLGDDKYLARIDTQEVTVLQEIEKLLEQVRQLDEVMQAKLMQEGRMNLLTPEKIKRFSDQIEGLKDNIRTVLGNIKSAEQLPPDQENIRTRLDQMLTVLQNLAGAIDAQLGQLDRKLVDLPKKQKFTTCIDLLNKPPYQGIISNIKSEINKTVQAMQEQYNLLGSEQKDLTALYNEVRQIWVELESIINETRKVLEEVNRPPADVPP